MTEKAYLTIVVPIYNVEKYLAQCIDSIVNQTVRRHQVVLVNDGSKDSSGEIAKDFAKQYPDFIRYIEQENKGLSAARNAGLALVDTPYVAFLDSDDWLMPDFVEVLEKRINQYYEAPDMVYTLPVVYDMARSRFFDWMDKPIFMEVFKEKEEIINPQQTSLIYGLEPNACRKVYNTSFLKKLNFSFVEGTKWEDIEPHFQLLHEARHIIGEERIGFCYRINSGNQITASGGMDRLQMVTVFQRTLHRALDENWNPLVVSYILKMMVSFLNWSVGVAKKDVRILLVDQMHMLFLEIPRASLKRYYADIHVGRKERLYCSLIRSRFYKIVANPLKFERLKQTFNKLKRILRRGN